MLTKYYKGNWKYLNAETVWYQSSIFPDEDIITKYYAILKNGMSACFEGYANDGASFVAIDTRTVLPGARFHDMWYQAMRQGELDGKWRAQADMELKLICLSDGMWRWRAAWIHRAVRLGAGPFAHPRRRRKLLIAGRATPKQRKEMVT